MRNYTEVEENAGIIAGEVATKGKSEGWALDGASGVVAAVELEKYLAKFNIGYVDDNTGSWAHRKNGSRHFSSQQLVRGAKSQLASVINFFQK